MSEDMLINREQALARERELEAEIASLREQNAMWQQYHDEGEAKYNQLVRKLQQENSMLRNSTDCQNAEIASLREQNATLRAEVERLTKGGDQ